MDNAFAGVAMSSFSNVGVTNFVGTMMIINSNRSTTNLNNNKLTSYLILIIYAKRLSL